MISSFRRLYRGEFVYVIVGDGPDRASIQERVKRLGLAEVAIFTGYQDDIHIPCALASAFLITGVEDLLGIAGLQAASLGVPIVSYQIDPTWENDEPLFFNSNSIQALAMELDWLLTDPVHRRESSRRSSEVVRSTFSVEQMILSYLHLYQSLIGDSSLMKQNDFHTEAQ